MADDTPTTRSCATNQVNERLIRTVPGYAEARAASENHALRMAYNPAAARTGCTTVPVVVHVVHKNNTQNISDAQINSQIAILNNDFRGTNADASSVPSVFAPLTGDARVQFELAATDPDGNPTDGVVRVKTSVDAFGSDDGVKSSSTNGSDAWPADRYLNIWVCQLGGGLLGYAQFPGGPAQTDGVVILHSAFGDTGTAAAPFDRGRTATHEIGHWLNLRHIWGDDGTGCSGSDFVADTPNQGGPNYGTPAFPVVSCGNGPNGDMFMNYMDYVDDAAMVMFTAGQVTRMQATLDGLRSAIGSTAPCGGPTPPCKPCPPPCQPPGPAPCVVAPCVVAPCKPCLPCQPCVPPCQPCLPPCQPCVPPPCKPCQPPPCEACGPCVIQPEGGLNLGSWGPAPYLGTDAGFDAAMRYWQGYGY